MKIKRIEHIAIAVKSMAQSREIFETKLGMTRSVGRTLLAITIPPAIAGWGEQT